VICPPDTDDPGAGQGGGAVARHRLTDAQREQVAARRFALDPGGVQWWLTKALRVGVPPAPPPARAVDWSGPHSY
jgi:hypothetical protein